MFSCRSDLSFEVVTSRSGAAGTSYTFTKDYSLVIVAIGGEAAGSVSKVSGSCTVTSVGSYGTSYSGEWYGLTVYKITEVTAGDKVSVSWRSGHYCGYAFLGFE